MVFSRIKHKVKFLRFQTIIAEYIKRLYCVIDVGGIDEPYLNKLEYWGYAELWLIEFSC